MLGKTCFLPPLSAFRFNLALARAKLKSAVIYGYLKLHAIVCSRTQAPLLIEWRLLYLFMLFLYSFKLLMIDFLLNYKLNHRLRPWSSDDAHVTPPSKWMTPFLRASFSIFNIKSSNDALPQAVWRPFHTVKKAWGKNDAHVTPMGSDGGGVIPMIKGVMGASGA